MKRRSLKVCMDESISVQREKARLDNVEKALVLPNDAQKAVCDMVVSITTLAVLNVSIIHINVFYSAYIDLLDVRVSSAGSHATIFTSRVYLDQPPALFQLKAIEDKLIEIVADEKDRIMGAI